MQDCWVCWRIILYDNSIIAVLSPSYDVFLTLAALTFLPIVMALLIIDKRLGIGQTGTRTALFPKILFTNNKCPNFVVRYLAIIGIITGVLSIIAAAVSADNNNDNDNNLHFNLLLQQPQQGVIEETDAVAIRNYAYEIFLLFSTFSPFLMFLLILCFPVKLMIKLIAKAVAQMWSEKNNKSIDTEESAGNNNGGDAHQYNILPDRRSSFHRKIRPATRTILLTLFAALPIVLTVTPHLPAINPDGQQIGVDTDYYVRWVTALINSKSTQEFIENAFVIQNNGDRPLTLVFLFIIAELVQGADLLHNFEYIIPAIFGPVLVLVVYFLTRQLVAGQPFNDVAPLLAAFLTAISFQILIGIYAGFYANWLALIISYLAFYFLFKFLKTSQTISIIIFSVLTILLPFSHIYTWLVSALVIVTFLSVMLKMNSYPKRNVALLLLVVITSSAIVVTRTAMTEWSYDGGILGTGLYPVDAHQQIVGLNQFTLRWDNLERTMHTFVGGQFSNFIILGLGLYWLYRSNWREPSIIFLMIFLSTGIFGFMFGNWETQTRVFYDIPFQIPAGIGLAMILNEARRTLASPLLFLLPICIWLLAMFLRSVFNFYYIGPSE
jgi:hypothetical protein